MMEPREETTILDTAEIVGGEPLRHLARYFIDGSLPETETLQTVFDTLAKDADTRVEAASLTQAASSKKLFEWAMSKNCAGAHRMRRLRQRSHAAFVAHVLDAMKGRSLSEAAKVLGVSRRQMFRYAADARQHSDPYKRFRELWATATESPSYTASLWHEMEGRLLRARTEAETAGVMAEATRLTPGVR